MIKRVYYNGGIDSYYPCSSPSSLKLGQEYEVIDINVRDWQTEYTLKGIQGSFNSVWFDEVTREVVMVVANSVPEIGRKYECRQIEIQDGKLKLVYTKTGIVNRVMCVGNNTYKIYTKQAIYMCKVA